MLLHDNDDNTPHTCGVDDVKKRLDFTLHILAYNTCIIIFVFIYKL